MMTSFHQSKAWRKLAKDHKTLQCACGSKEDIQSAHYLPQKKWPLMRLWRVNLYHACGKCNNKLGDKIYWSIRAVQLLVIYVIIKLLTWAALLLIIFIVTRVMWLDIRPHPFNTTFTYQALHEVEEAFSTAKDWISNY